MSTTEQPTTADDVKAIVGEHNIRFIRSDRRRSESSGTAAATWENRIGPSSSRTTTIAPVHRLPISSIASW